MLHRDLISSGGEIQGNVRRPHTLRDVFEIPGFMEARTRSAFFCTESMYSQQHSVHRRPISLRIRLRHRRLAIRSLMLSRNMISV